MRTCLTICSAALFLSGCFFNKKQDIELTSEPSIERALEILEGVPDGEPLIRFLYKNPIKFEYSNTAGLCHKFSLKAGKIFVPSEFKNSDALLALALARAAHIYRLHAMSGLEEIISEEEELAALFQTRIGLELQLRNADFAQNKFTKEMKSSLCTYIMDGSRAAALAARAIVLSKQPECQRPLETLQAQRIWLGQIREAINTESFFQLLQDRDRRRVEKGTLTMNEAMKNEAAIKTMPTYELYRYQRMIYDKQNGVFARIDDLYNGALKEDEYWRSTNLAAIENAREEFAECNLPQ
jgi:hypothetical protein